MVGNLEECGIKGRPGETHDVRQFLLDNGLLIKGGLFSHKSGVTAMATFTFVASRCCSRRNRHEATHTPYLFICL
jgi:hypothetical protein